MPAWPATLPQKPRRDGFSRSRLDARLRSTMDAGPDKVRRRYTAVPQFIQCTFLLTKDQLATFDTFYEATLAEGSLTFTWQHPITDASIVCRIKDIPQVVPNRLHWLVTVTIEVLP